MSVVPLAIEVSLICILAVLLLHRYGNWRKQHILVTLATFIAWYFSLMIVFIIPLDVSSVSLINVFYFNLNYLIKTTDNVLKNTGNEVYPQYRLQQQHGKWYKQNTINHYTINYYHHHQQ